MPRLHPTRATFHFDQESDSCETDGSGQELTIEIDSAGAGNFPILSTTRWAMDSDEVDVLAETIRWCLAQCEPKPPEVA
jgi:hypothetical protein